MLFQRVAKVRVSTDGVTSRNASGIVVTDFIQIDGCAEGQAVVGFARQRELNVQVAVEFCALARDVEVDDTDFSRTRKRNFCSCETSRGNQGRSSKENLFHGFPSFYIKR